MSQLVSPLCNILHQLMLFIMYRECAHLVFRETPENAVLIIAFIARNDRIITHVVVSCHNDV